MAKVISPKGRLGPYADIAEGQATFVHDFGLVLGRSLVKAYDWTVPILLVLITIPTHM